MRAVVLEALDDALADMDEVAESEVVILDVVVEFNDNEDEAFDDGSLVMFMSIGNTAAATTPSWAFMLAARVH